MPILLRYSFNAIVGSVILVPPFDLLILWKHRMTFFATLFTPLYETLSHVVVVLEDIKCSNDPIEITEMLWKILIMIS